jgi:hypothetical protein
MSVTITFLRSRTLGAMLDPSERVMSALRRSPITRNVNVTAPARAASKSDVP